jgi:hypothetical protein
LRSDSDSSKEENEWLKVKRNLKSSREKCKFTPFCNPVHCCFFALCSLLFKAALVCRITFGGVHLATMGNQPKLQLLWP